MAELLDLHISTHNDSMHIENVSTDCLPYEEPSFLPQRYVLVAIFGSFICVVGLLSSSMLIYLLWKQTDRVLRSRANTVHLIALAICDCVLLVSYLLIFPVEILIDVYRSVQLQWLWMHYIVYVFTASRISQFCIAYVMVLASIEHFISQTPSGASAPKYLLCSKLLQKHPAWTVWSVVLTGSVLRSTTLFELVVQHNENCTSLAAYSISQSQLIQSNVFYQRLYNFYFIQMVQVMIPFCLICFFNVLIIIGLRRQLKHRTLIRACKLDQLAGIKRETLKQTTKTLLLIASVYLVCNSLSLLLTFIEFFNKRLLLDDDELPRPHYIFLRDCSSLLSIINSSLRLSVCCLCSRAFKRAVSARLYMRASLVPKSTKRGMRFSMLSFRTTTTTTTTLHSLASPMDTTFAYTPEDISEIQAIDG